MVKLLALVAASGFQLRTIDWSPLSLKAHEPVAVASLGNTTVAFFFA